MVCTPPHRLAAAGAAATLAGTALFVLPSVALAQDSVEVDYTCGGAAYTSEEPTVTMTFTTLEDPGDLSVGDSVSVEMGLSPGPGFDLSAAGDGEEVRSASVTMDLDVNSDTVSLQGSPGLDAATWDLEGEFTIEESGPLQVRPGTITITQVVASVPEAEDDPEPEPLLEEPTEPAEPTEAEETPEEGTTEPEPATEAPETDPSPEAGEPADEQPAPADTQGDEETTEVTTTCEVTDEAPVLGAFDIAGGDDGSEAKVTTSGVDWSGDWVCTSDNPSLIASFEGPGRVLLTFAPEEFDLGEETQLVAESVSFTNMPARSETVPVGAMSAALGIPLSGPAAPADEVEISTVNAEAIDPEDTEIVFEAPDPITLTPEAEGELEADFGSLVLVTELSEGTVTHTCVADDGSSGSDGGGGNGDEKPNPQDEGGGSLPVTGTALTGLIATAIAALLAGGGAMLLARKRKAGVDDEL